jgi:hypothetical protein
VIYISRIYFTTAELFGAPSSILGFRRWHDASRAAMALGRGHQVRHRRNESVFAPERRISIALLSFFGSHSASGGNKVFIAEAIGNSLTSFGAGTVGAALAFATAYLTQLYYGNGSPTALRWHGLTYVSLATSVVGFIAGIYFARIAVIASL